MKDDLKIDLNEAGFREHPDLKSHLAFESFIALARKPGRELIVDRTLKRHRMKKGFLLVLAYMLSRRVRKWTSRPRVGILFPPGLAGYLANLAVVFAGKVPVNLNFTLGPANAQVCLRKSGIDCLLSTERVRQNMTHFPWPESGVVDLVKEMKILSAGKAIAFMAAVYFCPAKCLARWLKLPSKGGDTEAALLFTSGSSGEPKGVVLTHRNILANCLQIDATGLFHESEKIVANLPIFHSFGFTVTLWYPLLRGCKVVTLPSPLEVKKIAKVIREESATVLVGTPTFFRPYLKRIEPEQLQSLHYIIAGAEKTPPDFADLWEERFGSVYLEGYGLTETSPVVSVNLMEPPKEVVYPGSSGDARRRGSVGRLLPGQSARILHPETLEALEVSSVGLLALRGPNIFQAYLDEPEKTAEVLRDGWFITGDLARLDPDGFLYIEGRRSRFSKIGGEMVPHGTIEEVLVAEYGLQDSEFPMLAVAGRPDPSKGEVLVLIVAMDIELNDVRKKLSATGLPNLWIPGKIKRVEAIPILPTGKLDLQAIQALAL